MRASLVEPASTPALKASPAYHVSVAMCTYNGATFLPQQLQSIIGQTVPPGELIVCDDGSTDETLSILERFAAQAPFAVRVVRNERTLRPAQNFAQCIGLCTGDLILLTDQDDLWFCDRVENTVEAFTADPGLTFLFSECPLIDADGKDLGRSIYSSVPIPAGDRARLLEGSTLLPVLMRWGVLYGTSMAVRADLRSLFLPVPALWSHDEWIALILSAVGQSARLRKPVTHYRQHARQQVGTGDWTVQTHLGLAREHDRAFYERELCRYEQAISAVEQVSSTVDSQSRLNGILLPLLQQKKAFLRSRLRVQSDGLKALPVFTRLLLSGGYARFSSAVRSPLKDLLMLFGAL